MAWEKAPRSFLRPRGAKVVLGARRKDRIDSVVKEISATAGKAAGFVVDVTNRGQVETLMKEAVDNFRRDSLLRYQSRRANVG